MWSKGCHSPLGILTAAKSDLPQTPIQGSTISKPQNPLTGAASLPNEILDIIAYHLGRKTRRKSINNSYRHLIAASLVCTRWRYSFQRESCRYLLLTNRDRIVSFVQSKLLNMYYPLVELVLKADGDVQLPEVNEILKKVKGLKTLTFDCVAVTMGKKLLRTFKGLRQWSWTIYPHFIIATNDKILILPHLEELRIIVKCPNSSLVQVAQYFTMPSLKSLQVEFDPEITQYSSTEFGDFFCNVFLRNSSQLETLSIGGIGNWSRSEAQENFVEELIEYLPQVVSLRKLTLSFLDMTYNQNEEEVFPFDQIMASFPDTTLLTDVHFRVTANTRSALDDCHDRVQTMVEERSFYLPYVQFLTITCLTHHHFDHEKRETLERRSQFLVQEFSLLNMELRFFIIRDIDSVQSDVHEEDGFYEPSNDEEDSEEED